MWNLRSKGLIKCISIIVCLLHINEGIHNAWHALLKDLCVLVILDKIHIFLLLLDNLTSFFLFSGGYEIKPPLLRLPITASTGKVIPKEKALILKKAYH